MGRPTELSKLAKRLQRDEKELLTEALVTAGSIDGAAEYLTRCGDELFWPGTVRNELKRRKLRFRRVTTGRVEPIEASP